MPARAVLSSWASCFLSSLSLRATTSHVRALVGDVTIICSGSETEFPEMIEPWK